MHQRHWQMFAIVSMTWAFVAAGHAQSTPHSTQTYGVVIQKDRHGRLTADSVQQLEYAMEELHEYGSLRVWVEAKFNYKPLDPADSGFEAQQRRIREVLQGVVSRLDTAMDAIGPDAEYPSVGPYVNVVANPEGARSLVEDRDVQAFIVLVPAY